MCPSILLGHTLLVVLFTNVETCIIINRLNLLPFKMMQTNKFIMCLLILYVYKI